MPEENSSINKVKSKPVFKESWWSKYQNIVYTFISGSIAALIIIWLIFGKVYTNGMPRTGKDNNNFLPPNFISLGSGKIKDIDSNNKTITVSIKIDGKDDSIKLNMLSISEQWHMGADVLLGGYANDSRQYVAYIGQDEPAWEFILELTLDLAGGSTSGNIYCFTEKTTQEAKCLTND